MIDHIDLIEGIKEEIRATPHFIEYTVLGKEREKALWKITISVQDKSRNELDESLEGAAVWWKGAINGTAEILSVLPEDSKIILRYASQAPPESGEKIRIYLPKYLEALAKIWSMESWAQHCARWLDKLKTKNTFNDHLVPRHNLYQWLRRNQREAFNLLGFDIGFLHGPPGTGKTTTLGAMLAQILAQYPKHRVLLLSTTNLAVDEALISVDSALKQKSAQPAIEKIRLKECKRLGNHFVASKYADAMHLLPAQDKTLIEKLVALEAEKPAEDDLQKYSQWKTDIEEIRAKIKRQSSEILENSRLVAMTTTRAIYTFDALRAKFSADLIVFDESSQVGQAHALALAPLGKKCLFTGDPEQLAPIVKSKESRARTWLGQSMFANQKYFPDATVFLSEQSRMAEPICQIVSKTFYRGKLKVAGGCGIAWHDARDVKTSPVVSNHVSVRNIAQGANYSAQYGGWIRYESAKNICELIIKMKDAYELENESLLVLTPFRAQRRLLKTFLKKANIRGVKVSTVHRAQGGECHTVIFDPVDGDNEFLKTEDARRLVNVALSRAQARLILYLSEKDTNNPVFKQIGDLIGSMSRIAQVESKSTHQRREIKNDCRSMVLEPDFPKNALHKELAIYSKSGDIIGKITEVMNDGDSFKLFVYKTGEYKTFKTEYVKRNFQS